MKDDVATAPRFLVVGLAAVAIDALVYFVLHFHIGAAPAKAAGYGAGAVFGYIANWKFTFGARRGSWTEIAFIGTYLVSLGLNVVSNQLVIAVVGPVLAFFFATGISTVWNYFCLSRVVFKRVPSRLEDAR